MTAAGEKAQQVLLDRTLFVADPRRYRKLLKALDAPLKNRQALTKLFTRKTLWER